MGIITRPRGLSPRATGRKQVLIPAEREGRAHAPVHLRHEPNPKPLPTMRVSLPPHQVQCLIRFIPRSPVISLRVSIIFNRVLTSVLNNFFGMGERRFERFVIFFDLGGMGCWDVEDRGGQGVHATGEEGDGC